MQLYQNIGFAGIASLLLISCEKENNTSVSDPPDDDECVTTITVKATAAGAGEDQYIVIYKNNRDRAQSSINYTDDILNRNKINKTAIRKTLDGNSHGSVMGLSMEAATRLKQDDDIEMIEPDKAISLSTCFKIVEPRLLTWNINKVGFGSGSGKTAWIIDTGIDFNHPDLNSDESRSRTFINGQNSARDENGHGTHVAGIIGALNNRIGVLGVASGASLVACKVLDKEGDGLLSDIVDALNYVGKNADPGDVLNMSLGLEGTSNILDRQVALLAKQGVLIAIAAGNDGEEANAYSPARVNAPNVYTVSAIDSMNNFAHFSNYGNDVVDYAAPGVRIVSTYLNGRYARLSGTSMAAPHLAGLLLLTGGNIQSSGFAKNDPDGEPDRIASR
jgi:subtilisin